MEGWEEHYDPEKNSRPEPEQVYILEEDGYLRAMTVVLPLEVFVDGEPVPMGGIGDVVTHAAYRRRGYSGKLVRAVLGRVRERGVHLSMLHPFAHVFYRRYGWEPATEAISKSSQAHGPAEQLRVEARPSLQGRGFLPDGDAA